MGREVQVPEAPQRIISLVPSQTELLFELGLAHRVVGITKFCIHPKEACKNTTKIGGTKNFRFEHIAALQPDLIIGNKEENYREGIEQLATQYPVWMSDIYTLADSLEMMQTIGQLTQTEAAAQALVQEISLGFRGLASASVSAKPLRVLYLIWRKPWMAAGCDTFIHQMLEACGWQNALTDPKSRYPELSDADLKQLSPQVVLLSSEPYPFAEKHLADLQALLPEAKLLLVDGELFSWYGSRLRHAPAYFSTLQTTLGY
jgi:ABC-type Fe3+-hydroxamate transport system substrate-binding protein